MFKIKYPYDERLRVFLIILFAGIGVWLVLTQAAEYTEEIKHFDKSGELTYEGIRVHPSLGGTICMSIMLAGIGGFVGWGVSIFLIDDFHY